ncbi:MAG TPA: hypothetical protein VN666_14595, partial [Nitrospira sp.]|nr:hypothetical protein [Nitrospira sp.]
AASALLPPPCTKLTTRRRTSNEHLMPYSSSVHPICLSCLSVIMGLAIDFREVVYTGAPFTVIGSIKLEYF